MEHPKTSEFLKSLGITEQNYELTLPNGVTIKTDGTDADHAKAMEALEKIGPLSSLQQTVRTLRTLYQILVEQLAATDQKIGC